MKKWNFKVKSNPQQIINKLSSALDSANGFVFNIDQDNNDSAKFNFRKPIKYPDQILHRNRIIVNGKILKAATEDETNVEISFTQHFFLTLTVFSVIFAGIGTIAYISRINSSPSMYIFGGVVLAVGFVLWIALQKKFERDIQNYKVFISKIVES